MKRGSILAFAVWLLTFLSLLAIGLYKMNMAQMRIAGRMGQWVLSPQAAASVVKLLQWQLEFDQSNYDTLLENKSFQEVDLGKVKAVFYLEDEESKINLNTMSQDAIANLPGMDRDLAIEITASPLRPFYALEQLKVIDGVDEEIYAEFAPYVTVTSSGKVNINTASPEVLSALGFDDRLLGIIELFRHGPDREEGTGDDGIFLSVRGEDGVLALLESFITPRHKQQINAAMRWLDVKGTVFTAVIETQVLGRPTAKYDIIIKSDKILRWKEGI